MSETKLRDAGFTSGASATSCAPAPAHDAQARTHRLARHARTHAQAIAQASTRAMRTRGAPTLACTVGSVITNGEDCSYLAIIRQNDQADPRDFLRNANRLSSLHQRLFCPSSVHVVQLISKAPFLIAVMLNQNVTRLKLCLGLAACVDGHRIPCGPGSLLLNGGDDHARIFLCGSE